MTDYNQLYAKQPEVLGAPYAALMDAVTRHVPTGAHILDVGAGQGRDALPLARAGYRMTAMDAAPAGIAAINSAARAEGLSITAQTADLTDWTSDERFDEILCNRILHMLDTAPRHDALHRLLACLLPQGYLFLVDEPGNMPALKSVIAQTGRSARMIKDTRGDVFVQFDV